MMYCCDRMSIERGSLPISLECNHVSSVNRNERPKNQKEVNKSSSLIRLAMNPTL